MLSCRGLSGDGHHEAFLLKNGEEHKSQSNVVNSWRMFFREIENDTKTFVTENYQCALVYLDSSSSYRGLENPNGDGVDVFDEEFRQRDM